MSGEARLGDFWGTFGGLLGEQKNTGRDEAQTVAGRSVTYIACPTAVSCRVGDEYTILNTANNTYYSLNQSGSELWPLLQEPATVEDLTAHLCRVFGVDTRDGADDVRSLLEELRRQGLVEQAVRE